MALILLGICTSEVLPSGWPYLTIQKLFFYVVLVWEDDIIQVDQAGFANFFLPEEIHWPFEGIWGMSDAECKAIPLKHVVFYD